MNKSLSKNQKSKERYLGCQIRRDATLVIWGPSAKLLSEDKDLQDYVKKIMDQGTDVKACKGCADMYEVSPKLEELGITVKYMGKMTDYFKEGRHILSL